ncbi:MAG: maltose phosphorylase [Carnobacterium sp.]|uniref:glycoside hydrolase family 65 protein n=1 Tax=Carnobacterium sp. TaxID=48221 RepID=UPI00264A3E72|nr:glycosyl hydrolase family 65 protein [Carnobacterium sp.]MDN5372138.1 maltose phosphorylase [Carnobacterium sp.]
MAKIADQYFKLDSWKIIEEGFDPAYSLVSESIFSLGNEYMGVRGYFEEGSTTDTLLGSYFNGVYENNQEQSATAYKGIVTKKHFMVNAVDWLYTRIVLDDEYLDMKTAYLEGFKRILDMREGILTREFIWQTKSGKRLKVLFERFLHMENSVNGYQKITFIPENFSGEIEVIMGLDFNTTHGGTDFSYWKEMRKGSNENHTAIIGETISSNQQVFSGMTVSSNQQVVKQVIEKEKFVGFHLQVPLFQKEESYVEKLVSNVVKKQADGQTDELWDRGQKELTKQAIIGYSKARKTQRDYWTNIWKTFDVQIEGDEKNQQGIRFCIFQLQQTYHGQDPTNNIGAKGLTGEAYSGHCFWDTETCCLPFYLFNNLKAAKNLLEFRYSTLPEAKDRAKELDCQGACYPIATLNGTEACDLWQHASTQFQPSTGVAYGIWHYEHLSNDKKFLYGHGIEMLVEISRFLKSRGDWSQKTGKFSFYGVMGPDEFQVMVNHNGYTNFMAKMTFIYTANVLNEMKTTAPKQYSVIQKATFFTETEIIEWKKAATNMLMLENENGLFEQHAGFFDLPHIDVDAIPVEEFPLYSHWSYDRIYRNDMIKQPDVLMFQFLYNQQFSHDSKKVNYDYYEPRTIHESSLSPSIHSILASELQKHEEAFDYFGFATRMDLDNYNRNTGEGLHTTSIAAAWVNIVYGFGGLRSDGPVLLFNPSIPKEWDSYTFQIEYKKALISVSVTKTEVEFKVTNGESVHICIYDKAYTIDDTGIKVGIPTKWQS